ncbi:MlaD family protein [Legionella israelensis]|uniref:Putative transmembrane protein n=1 Tax=Legionella israelensis TaxID=454 RepID=A0A0W0WNF8_9GAMM|nr:MlaD family protein [Legionella israelensis]KTD33638.1 putative transmembrane protein [Legionella israelensis]QBS08781.1 MCE family protein [Legionella israelensis]SCY12208.1 MlaD protein [Legionella israelensis DSM 19235]STX58458.1 putative transmembrane protein [Legionella israelensis]
MRQERLYTLIGIFVVGAFGLLIYGSIFFYNEYIKEKMETYVLFFKGSLNGLESRSTVTYRGVKIGEVSFIELTENTLKNMVDVVVYVQFFVDKTGFRDNPIRLLINKGFVADISKPNFLTGVASIELIQTDKPPSSKQHYYRGYPIFPTVPQVEKYTSFDETLKSAKKTLDEIREFLQTKELQKTAESLRKMADSIEILANNLNQNVSPFVAYFSQSLKEVGKAAYSTQNLMDYLSRHPESLLRGKM